jgi:DNA-binding PadR family transcriptional regulator
MSRPLLYMHLDRLEKAGLVRGHLELSDDGKAMKYFELVPFELRVTAETVISALAADHEQGNPEQGNQEALKMEESKNE